MAAVHVPNRYTSVFELARHVPDLNSAAFHRLYDLSLAHPKCKATPALHNKYGVATDNSQAVLRVTNKVTLSQTWFNEDRTKKPQNFTAASADAAAFDPLEKEGGTCDFCHWHSLTAEDSWGRVEGPHAVSASNLFKYVKPAQGVVLFKHHNPLQFSLQQLQDLLAVSSSWFQRAAADVAHHDAARGSPARHLHPLLVWNCLPRAGASQYHGHAQVMLSDAPFPALQQEAESVASYDLLAHTASRGYYQDVLAAHEDVGLLLREGREGDLAFAYASLAPWKDMEVCVHGSGLESGAFQRLFFCALRALIDELGAQTFNAAIYNIRLPPPDGSNGSTRALGSQLLQPGRGLPVPVVARVVSRGKLGSLASDFGGLEVFGGASIGHTDPYRLIQALERVQAQQLAAL